MSEKTIMRLMMVLGLGFILTIVIATCGGNGQTDIDIDPTSAVVPLVPVRVALDWYPNANHIGLYIADERGYFREEGLKVDLYTPSDPSTVLQTVGAGQDDFGISYQPDILLARAQNVPVVAVAAMVQHPLNSVMALKSSGIERPADLKGKKVGYPGIPTNEPLLDTMLKFDGLSGLEDVELVNVGFNLAPALISGQVDAVVGAYWTHESILVENQGYEVSVLRMEEWGVPDYYELMIVASELHVENDTATIEKFMRAVRRGYDDAMSDPQGGVDVLVRGTQEEVDETVDRPGADLLPDLWRPASGRFGNQDPARWESFTKWMQDNGLISSDVKASDAFSIQFQE
jgi:putative hydroxymethylpyrimidine transport system substrate-binding protein